MTDEQHISVEEDGQVVARATVSVSNSEALASVNVSSGHVPVGTRKKVVDAVHETVLNEEAEHLTASVPLGDAELVEGMRSHLDDVRLRAAGATSIISGTVKTD